MNKLLKKLTAVLLLMCLMSANLSVLGVYGVTYALSENELANQNSKTQDQNVEFNAYFDGGEHARTEKIDSLAKIYLDIKVNGTGYLEKGVISFQNTNFEIDQSINRDSNIQSVSIKNNKILLNKISGGSSVKIEVPVHILNADEVSIDNFSKETKTTFTATYINSNAKEKNVSKEIINKLSWDGTTDKKITAEVKSELAKYITYTADEKSVVILQTKINSGIKENVLPTKEKELNIQVPEINNVKPTSVNVIANQTKSTNGEENGLNFNQENYTYNQGTGTLTINVKNLTNKISWLKNVNDEYLVTYIFENKEVFDYVSENGINTNLKINGNIKVYSNQEKSVKIEEIHSEINANKTIGELVDYSISADSNIAKGQAYANYDTKNKKETPYNVSFTATVSSADLTDSLKFEQKVDQFVTKDEYKNATTVAGNNYTYNKTIKIAKNVFEKILGEEGKIEIFDTQNSKIGTINKTSTLENDNYKLDISNLNNNQLTIITSKPVAEGQLTINVEKAIKEELDYTKQQFKSFTKIYTQLNNSQAETLLTEPKTVVEVEINKKDLTTVVENENVEIRAILDTSSVNNALYKDTTLKIKLPEYVSRFKINSYDILMANGLKIKDLKLARENGQVVINVQLAGKQSEYTIDAQYKGTIILFNTNITTKTLTPNNKNKITMDYENSNDVATNAKGTVETSVNFVAPQGIITANGISNYSKTAKDLLSISSEGTTGTIQTYAEKRIATITGKVVNNYDNKIKDIVILGRIPVQGNKEIETGKDLGSTFNTKLTGNVELKEFDTSKYTVYYSENVNATKDLNEQSNTWTTKATSEAKSYMIVLNDDYEMENGETLEVAYNVEIPENITYNNTVNEVYKVYYTNVSSIGEISESKTSPVVKLSTGEGPDLSVELSTTTSTVREGQIVRITATVKNIGTVDAKNVKLNLTAPDGTVHTEIIDGTKSYTDSKEKIKTVSIGNLTVGQTITEDYELRIEKGKVITVETDEETGKTTQEEENKYPGDKEIECNASITADVLENEIKADPCKLKVLEGDLKITNIPSAYEYETLKKGKNIQYNIKLENISNDKDLENVTLNVQIPQGIKIKDTYYSDDLSFKQKNKENVVISNNNISVNVGKLESINAYINRIQDSDSDIPQLVELREYVYICIELEIENYTGEFIAKATAKADGIEEHCSNIKKYNIEEVKLTLQQKELNSRYVKEGKEFTYTYVIENTGKISALSNSFEMDLPEEILFVKAEYTNNNKNNTVKSTRDPRKLKISIYEILPNEKITMTVTVKADLLPDKNDKTITTYASLDSSGLDKIESNKVNVTIEYDPNAHVVKSDDDKKDDSTATTYKITGTAWLDSNKNGMRDEDEQLLSGIKVMLAYKKTSKIVKDSKTNTEKITTTNAQGQYQFDNLLPDEYFVIFDYGNGNYNLTEYRKPEVSEALNSDAIDSTMTLNGIKTIVGISDAIKITNSNVRDIDIGVYIAEKFDLKLDKYIDKITRTTPTSGTETFEYSKEKNTKIEVLKQNLGKSSIVIEYKIVVTNEGGVAGYVKKIADYLPKGVVFNTELNNDWYLAKDGNVYNTSLENTIINPGESKEVTLVLLKQITDDSIGILNNNAEIYESYNEQGLKDIDSTPANKQEDEDDMSKADIILGVVTGAQIAFYVILTLTVIAMVGFGIFEIKKRVFSKKINERR